MQCTHYLLIYSPLLATNLVQRATRFRMLSWQELSTWPWSHSWTTPRTSASGDAQLPLIIMRQLLNILIERKYLRDIILVPHCHKSLWWISAPFTICGHKNRITPRCSSVAQTESGAVIFKLFSPADKWHDCDQILHTWFWRYPLNEEQAVATIHLKGYHDKSGHII